LGSTGASTSSRPACPTGQCGNFCSNFAFRETQLVELLQIHPELRRRAKPMAETQCRIGCYAALTVNNTRYAVHRHANLARKFGGGDADLAQFFGKMLTGMDRRAGHDDFLQW
jgi:hypothetical protein